MEMTGRRYEVLVLKGRWSLIGVVLKTQDPVYMYWTHSALIQHNTLYMNVCMFLIKNNLQILATHRLDQCLCFLT